MTLRCLALAVLALSTVPAVPAPHAQGVPDLSTHVLDLARGVGGAGVPVTLDARIGDAWHLVGRATTAETGRVSAFTSVDECTDAPAAGVYRLTFDMSGYWASLGGADAAGGADFFPEITVQFRIADPAVHAHVPVVVSPYGYSTYRGN